jgi:hypothetical protein
MNSPAIAYGNDTIHIDQIVARVKTRLQIRDISDYDKDVELFINEAGYSLGAKAIFIKKNCRMEISCGRVTLPKGLKKPYGVRPIIDDCQVTLPVNSIWVGQGWNQDLLYLDQTFFDTCQNEFPTGCSTYNLNEIYQQQGSQLVFPIPNYFTHAIISYSGYLTDCEGLLEMKAKYERPFGEYAYQMMLRTYPQLWLPEWGNRETAIDRAERDWVAGRMNIISDGFADDWEQNHFTIKRILHSLLQNQNHVNQL